MSDAIKALAANMVARKQAGLDPYVLFLGAGASISSGCSSMLRIVDDVLQAHDSKQFYAWQKDIEEATVTDERFGKLLRKDIDGKKVERFLEIWGALDGETRYAILRTHLWNDKSPSAGYLDLAHLIKAGYFSIILSTNLDNLIEKALHKAELIQPHDFMIVVNGKDSPEEIQDQLEHSRIQIKLVKLHGTLESPRSYAFTIEELFNFERTIKPAVARLINQSLLIVGHSMQDRDLNVLFEQEGKEIHFVNPARPDSGSPIYNIMKVRGLGSIVDGEAGKFDNFFRQLRAAIEQTSAGSSTGHAALPIDGFLESIGYESELKVPRSRYKNLQTLYVKPTEYDDILKKLEQEHILFIIGEPHMGKTYTAVYILWEYFQKGYETFHIRHDEFINRLHRHDGDLKSLLLELFTPKGMRPRIVHFDDPFGETLERRTEAFAAGLDMLLEMGRSYEHLRIVITSRLNIFNEFLAENEIRNDIDDLEKTLRVHTSYRSEVLLDILHRYIQFHKPDWASDEQIIRELDEKLPEMLPAPHNIQFFVSTSGTLTTIESVLAHVEESKKMISALASWMKHMPPHEQVFLLWVEVSSTASILFTDERASNIDIERTYNRSLAFLFEEGHISGIPTMPFSTARDKFETILLERREENGKALKLDFVHPSYHEAFWYAVKRKFPLAHWWELLSKNVGRFVSGDTIQLDLVQLKMIERYGSINRDLDQLLLISAESEDVAEQLIALEHMLRRPEQFTPLPQFHSCMTSIASSRKYTARVAFMRLYSEYFEHLPLDMIDLGTAFLFDTDDDVRAAAHKAVLSHFDKLPESVRQGKFLQTWLALSNFVSGILSFPQGDDWLPVLQEGAYEHRTDLSQRLSSMSTTDIQQLFNIPLEPAQGILFDYLELIWHELSSEQKEVIIKSIKDEAENVELSTSKRRFVERHINDPVIFDNFNTIVQPLVNLARTFGIPSNPHIISAFHHMSPADWPPLNESSLRELATTPAFQIGTIVTARILEGYDEIAPEHRAAHLSALISPEPVPYLHDYVDGARYEFKRLSNNVLVELLKATGRVQYEVLPSLLCRFDDLSADAQQVIDNLINNPPNWWVAGSIGQTTQKKFADMSSKKSSDKVKDIVMKIIGLRQKQLTGALLAEIAQTHFSSGLELQEQYLPILHDLIKDPEVIRHAERWMDHQLEVFKFKNSDWQDVKTCLREESLRSK